jgi:hypothetical protein
MSQDYRLVSELVRPGDSLPCPEGTQPMVQPTAQPGFVRVTYLRPVTRVPFTDDADVAYVQ